MSRRRNLLVGWALALLAIALFASLGRWQARRAVEKQAMLDAVAQVLSQRQSVALTQAADPQRTHGYDWAQGAGRFDARGPLWLDNQQRNGRPGVRVYRIFVAEQAPAPLLVDLGWLPLPANRTMPSVELPAGRIELRGLLTPPPSSGLPLGSGIVKQGDGWVLTRVDPAAIAGNTGLSVPLAARVLRLDPTLPLGYERDLALLSNTLPPEKHRGYSVQWFALALAALVTALVLTFRKARSNEKR
ncbi:MAG TPA: SURF1 family protein [Lysobacter sp.]|nr:SURF1 family protein [Lysobacter sp.]